MSGRTGPVPSRPEWGKDSRGRGWVCTLPSRPVHLSKISFFFFFNREEGNENIIREVSLLYRYEPEHPYNLELKSTSPWRKDKKGPSAYSTKQQLISPWKNYKNSLLLKIWACLLTDRNKYVPTKWSTVTKNSAETEKTLRQVWNAESSFLHPDVNILTMKQVLDLHWDRSGLNILILSESESGCRFRLCHHTKSLFF